MNKQQFKAQYVTNFLAAYMANRYDNDCLNGHPGKPYDNQPISNAYFLAECAWLQIQHQTHEVRSVEDGIFNLDEK